MLITLSIEYRTRYGEELAVTLGGKRYPMRYVGDGRWECAVDCVPAGEVEYSYELCRGAEVLRREWGAAHRLTLDKSLTTVAVADRWHAEPSDRPLRSSMFTDGVFARERSRRAVALKKGELMIRAEIPSVRPWQKVVLVGDTAALGQW